MMQSKYTSDPSTIFPSFKLDPYFNKTFGGSERQTDKSYRKLFLISIAYRALPRWCFLALLLNLLPCSSECFLPYTSDYSDCPSPSPLGSIQTSWHSCLRISKMFKCNIHSVEVSDFNPPVACCSWEVCRFSTRKSELEVWSPWLSKSSCILGQKKEAIGLC